MVSHAPPAVAPPPIFRPDWKTLARLASRRSKPLDLDTCPAPTSLCRFCGATDKPRPGWFWGTNQETVAVILRQKSLDRSCHFWGTNQETRATGFDAKPRETVDLGFEAHLRNPLSLSPCARCWPHTASPDLPIGRPPSTRPVLDHPRSSTPGLLLLPRSSSLPAMSHLSPTHHETSKHDSPHEHR
jgi:hypothetical protein